MIKRAAKMALTLEGSRKIRDRKSIWMVCYIRARESGDRLKKFYRRQHFLEAEK